MLRLPLLLVLASAPPGEPRPVSFDEALGLAAEAPAVAGARAALGAQRDLDARISSQVANPQLTVQPGYRPSPNPGERRFEGSVGLSQSWSLAGLSGARRDAARGEEEVLAAEARAAALSHRLAAAQAWIDLWAAQQALTDSRQELAIARDLADRVGRAAEAAALTRADAAEADAYRAEARLQAIAAEGEVVDLGFQLARQMGQRSGVPFRAEGILPRPALPPPPDFAALVARAEALPEVAALRLAAGAERAREVEARAARGAALQLGVIAQRDNLGSNVVYGAVGLALPVFDRGEREAAPLAAAAARARGEHAEAAARAATELARSLHEVEHAREVLEAVERELLPAAVESARLREAAMRAGDATVLEVLVARRTMFAARARWARASAAHAWAAVKVWLLVSGLPPGDDPAPGGRS